MPAWHDANLAALDEIEDLLEAYADARLTPHSPVLSRMRAVVMAEARAAEALLSPVATIDTDIAPPARWASLRLSMGSMAFRRRVITFAGAGMLAVISSTAVLAAPPGSPFFDARVAIGGAFLPPEVDARLAAHEQRISDWLFEAQLAAARGDYVAMADALQAYQGEVDAAVIDIDDNVERLAHLEEELSKHTDVLTALLGKVPDQANIEHAIDASSKAIGKLNAREHPSHPDQGHEAPGRD